MSTPFTAASTLLFYLALAAVLLWATSRFVRPLTLTAALVLAALPCVFTGPALVTAGVYAPIDFPYLTTPLKPLRAEHGLDEDSFSRTRYDVAFQMIPWRKATRFSVNLLGPLAEQGFATLLALVVCYATVFGLVEIGVTAYAAESGRPALAGVLLGVMSIGSAAGAIGYGSRTWNLPLSRQFGHSLAFMGLGILPLAWFSSAAWFGLWCVIAGIAMTPTLIIQATLVVKIVRSEHATEGFTWSATALLSGVGLGLAAGGLLLESGDVSRVFWFAALVACVAALPARVALRG